MSKADRKRSPSDPVSKEMVTSIWLLDGREFKQAPRHTTRRNVYMRRNGSHYIITLGYREDVFLQEDGTFIEYVIAHRIDGGIGA